MMRETDSGMQDRINWLRETREWAKRGGGMEKIARQHQRGRLTARERIDRLLDPGSFCEFNMLWGHAIGAPGDGVVAGHGTIDGRPVLLFAQDATVLGGSIGALHGAKVYKTIERAMDARVPFIGLWDSPGGRVPKLRGEAAKGQEGFGAVNTMGLVWGEKSTSSIFFANTQASGLIPQISAILGPCAGVAVYSPMLTDFIFMVDKTSNMFLTGPRIVKSIMGEEIDLEELGGARVHSHVTGIADFRVQTEDDCLRQIKKLLSLLPSNNEEKPPLVDTGDDPERMVDTLEGIVPSDLRKPYDMHRVITELVDNGDFLEVKREYAREMIVGFGRLGGQVVGLVANQTMHMAGGLTCEGSVKEARFIRFCDCFNIPIVLLVDTPAYVPGVAQEHGGIIRHGAKVVYALCEAVVPRIAVVLRKGYGGGTLGMGHALGIGTDVVFDWPIAEFGTLGPEASVDLFYEEEVRKAENPQEFRDQLIKEYRERYSSPSAPTLLGSQAEEVIEPRETRRCIVASLRLLQNKKLTRVPKRHGNIPL